MQRTEPSAALSSVARATIRSVSSRVRAARSPPARAWTACWESVWMGTASGPNRRAWSAAQLSASKHA
eukprot:1721968-Alexandrium_andersonii.AAC.1